jgi:hypothetical protein
MKRTRFDRTKDFDSFFDKCEEIFKTLRDNDKKAERYQNEYMLCVCPGSRAGGQEKRIIEVFWGGRAYEFETKGKSWKSLNETGVTLSMYRNDTGHITVSLYPAKTEFIKPIEDSIAIYKWLDPQKLNNKRFVKSLWNDFMAYMECTSLDGSPTLRQRFRIFYFRHFKNLVVNKIWQPTKFGEFSKSVLKFVLTVGLSGFVFFFVSVLNDSGENELKQSLNNIDSNSVIIIHQLDSIYKSKDSIISAIESADSINYELDSLIELTYKRNEILDGINRNTQLIIKKMNKDK